MSQLMDAIKYYQVAEQAKHAAEQTYYEAMKVVRKELEWVTGDDSWSASEISRLGAVITSIQDESRRGHDQD